MIIYLYVCCNVSTYPESFAFVYFVMKHRRLGTGVLPEIYFAKTGHQKHLPRLSEVDNLLGALLMSQHDDKRVVDYDYDYDPDSDYDHIYGDDYDYDYDYDKS